VLPRTLIIDRIFPIYLYRSPRRLAVFRRFETDSRSDAKQCVYADQSRIGWTSRLEFIPSDRAPRALVDDDCRALDETDRFPDSRTEKPGLNWSKKDVADMKLLEQVGHARVCFFLVPYILFFIPSPFLSRSL